MRQGTRFLIGPLVGVVALAATLTGCGSSDNDADRVVSPPTTEVTITTEVAETTATTPTTVPPTTAAPATTPPTTAAPIVPTTKPAATAAPGPPTMSAQELDSLEAQLNAIDAILNELTQNFSAD